MKSRFVFICVCHIGAILGHAVANNMATIGPLLAVVTQTAGGITVEKVIIRYYCCMYTTVNLLVLHCQTVS